MRTHKSLMPIDIPALLARIPLCHTLVTTGQKATEVISSTFGCPVPPIGGHIDLVVNETPDQVRGDGPLRFWRMPSTSRAYPLPLEQKAEAYRQLFK